MSSEALRCIDRAAAALALSLCLSMSIGLPAVAMADESTEAVSQEEIARPLSEDERQKGEDGASSLVQTQEGLSTEDESLPLAETESDPVPTIQELESSDDALGDTGVEGPQEEAAAPVPVEDDCVLGVASDPLDPSAGGAQSNEPVASKKQVVADGAYVIKTGVGSNLVLDTAGSNTSGTNVVQASYAGGTKQVWSILYDAARELYQIFRTCTDGSRLALDVAGASTANGANVQLYASNESDAQWWDIVASNGGFRFVSALRDDLVLDVSGASSKSGANVQLYTNNASAAQKFFLYAAAPDVAKGERPVSDGTYQIVSTLKGGTGNVVDISGGSLSNQGNAQVYANNASIAQRFHLSYANDGYYQVVCVGSGRVLDAAGGGLLPGTNVQQYAANGSSAQQWALHPNGNGTYTLINRANGLALDITAASTKSGANLQVYTPNGSAAQQFTLRGIEMLPSGIFTIKALPATGQVVDITSGSATSGAQAQLYASNDTLAQKYEVVRVGTNEYRIRTAASGGWLTAKSLGTPVTQEGNHATAVTAQNTWRAEWAGGHLVLVNKATGAALAMSGGKTANGTKLVTSAVRGDASQQFTLSATQLLGPGYYFIANLKGPYLDIKGDSTAAGANVQVYAKGTELGQYFYLERSGSVYRIKNAFSGKYVGATAKTSGSNVTQQTSSSSNAQRWYARIADGGGVAFECVNAPGMVLDVVGGGTANGTNVQLYKANSSAAQAWKPIKTTYQPFMGYMLKAVNRANASSSRTKYLIVVDRSNTRTIIMTGGNGNWKPYKDLICTVGASWTPTVTGSFTVGYKGYSFGEGFTCYYWTQFYEDYLFHSVLYRQGTRTIQDGRLGIHASHGCVRLNINEAKWIYDNIPSGTRVIVY